MASSAQSFGIRETLGVCRVITSLAVILLAKAVVTGHVLPSSQLTVGRAGWK